MWMAPCSHRLHLLLLLLLCCLRASRCSTAAAAVEALSYYSFPVFDGKSTADGVAVATNSAMLAPATFLFDAQIFPQFNQSEGYVLLSRPVALWRMDDDAAVRGEASFNTSFTVASGSVSEPVAFVVLLDSFPPLNRKNEKHGPGADADSGVSVPNATSGLAAVEVGTVSSYGPRHRGVGLNVTITPNRTSSAAAAGQLAVRIEYDAAAHRLSVYAGDTPDPLVLDAPLDLASRLPTRAALVGFFADTVRDVVVGVRDWELTVDRLHDNDDEARREEAAKQSSSVSLVVILVAAIGSVAAVAVVVVASVMVCLVVSRRRALDKELQQCYNACNARTEKNSVETGCKPSPMHTRLHLPTRGQGKYRMASHTNGLDRAKILEPVAREPTKKNA